jgi:methyl-accepting chemotaxis protein
MMAGERAMTIRTKFFISALLGQIAVIGVAMQLGSTLIGWGVSLAAALASLFVLDVMIRRGWLEPLAKLGGTIKAVRMEGDLSLRMGESHDAVGLAAKQLNELLENFQSIVGKVMFNSTQVAASAESLEGMAAQVADGSRDQQAAAAAASQAIEQMIGNIQSIAEHARQAALRAAESRTLSSEGGEIARQAADEMERIARAFEDSAAAISHLSERTLAINGIARTISEIADQTNLLALNAAIEAARAGEQGRGFAVVADEVRKLAERTSAATGEIAILTGGIGTDTAATIDKVHSGAALAREGTQLARRAEGALTRIGQSCHEMQEQTSSIASAIGEQTVASELVGQKVHAILQLAEQNAVVVQQVQEQSSHLDHLAVNLKELDNVFKLGESGVNGQVTHRKATQVVQAAARSIGQALEQAIAARRIDIEALFDEKYLPIPGVRPPKFHTRFDTLTDALFPAIQEPILAQNPDFVYAGAVDRNGYFPTHNKKFSAESTGDLKQDTLFSRSKRIFNDVVGKRCGAHDRPFLLQTYRRDTGEVMHDVSSPIFVNGRQWGGFRIGYRA